MASTRRASWHRTLRAASAYGHRRLLRARLARYRKRISGINGAKAWRRKRQRALIERNISENKGTSGGVRQHSAITRAYLHIISSELCSCVASRGSAHRGGSAPSAAKINSKILAS